MDGDTEKARGIFPDCDSENNTQELNKRASSIFPVLPRTCEIIPDLHLDTEKVVAAIEYCDTAIPHCGPNDVALDRPFFVKSCAFDHATNGAAVPAAYAVELQSFKLNVVLKIQ